MTKEQLGKLYTDYLHEFGYGDFLYGYDDPEAEFEAEACMVDVTDDNVPELLLHITDKSSVGVRGFASVSVLLGVEDGSVRQLGFANYGGGSGGGDYLYIRYDTVEKKHVLQYEEFVRDGMFFSTLAYHWYNVREKDTEKKLYGMAGEGDVVYASAHSLRSSSFAKEGVYAEDAKKVLDETDLFTQEEGIVTAYQYDGVYISEAKFDEISGRFIEPTDPAYQMKPVTLETPIPA